MFIEGIGWLTGNADVTGWFMFGRAFDGEDAESPRSMPWRDLIVLGGRKALEWVAAFNWSGRQNWLYSGVFEGGGVMLHCVG